MLDNSTFNEIDYMYKVVPLEDHDLISCLLGLDLYRAFLLKQYSDTLNNYSHAQLAVSIINELATDQIKYVDRIVNMSKSKLKSRLIRSFEAVMNSYETIEDLIEDLEV